MRAIYRTIVAALIISRDDKILMGKKDPKKGGVYVDCWHIPGGGVDEGETKEEAVRREVLEEVGIATTPYEVTLIDDQGKGSSEKTLKTGERVLAKMSFYVYRIDLVDKVSTEVAVKLSDDLAEYKWVTKIDLPKIKLTPPSIELFTKLGYL